MDRLQLIREILNKYRIGEDPIYRAKEFISETPSKQSVIIIVLKDEHILTETMKKIAIAEFKLKTHQHLIII